MGVSERGKPGFFERWRIGGPEKKDEEIMNQKNSFQRNILKWSHLAMKRSKRSEMTSNDH